jgi:hypothetical protein
MSSSESWCTVCSVRWRATRETQGPCATSGTFKLPTFTLVHPLRIFPILPEGKSNSMSLVREESVSTLDVKHGSGGSVRRTWRRHRTVRPFSLLANSVSIRTGPAWETAPVPSDGDYPRPSRTGPRPLGRRLPPSVSDAWDCPRPLGSRISEVQPLWYLLGRPVGDEPRFCRKIKFKRSRTQRLVDFPSSKVEGSVAEVVAFAPKVIIIAYLRQVVAFAPHV